MRTTSSSELGENSTATIESVSTDHEPVIITGSRGEAAAVLLSVDDYAPLGETAYLLRSPRNAERSLAAIADLDSGGGTPRDISE